MLLKDMGSEEDKRQASYWGRVVYINECYQTVA